jgi:hypothetical protein
VDRRPVPAPVHRHRAHFSVGAAGLTAFVATLVIPAVAALWWLLAAATVLSVMSVTGTRLWRVSRRVT